MMTEFLHFKIILYFDPSLIVKFLRKCYAIEVVLKSKFFKIWGLKKNHTIYIMLHSFLFFKRIFANKKSTLLKKYNFGLSYKLNNEIYLNLVHSPFTPLDI